jgi:hypothetical protein
MVYSVGAIIPVADPTGAMWRENVAMEIAETFIAAKTGRDRDCEDGIVVTDSLAAVIDGATDKTGYRFQGLTGGRYAMLACADALHSLDGGADALETVAHLSMVLAERLPPGLARGRAASGLARPSTGTPAS